jgi:hypothetical protein
VVGGGEGGLLFKQCIARNGTLPPALQVSLFLLSWDIGRGCSLIVHVLVRILEVQCQAASIPAVVPCTAVKLDIAQHDCDCYAVDDVPPG